MSLLVPSYKTPRLKTPDSKTGVVVIGEPPLSEAPTLLPDRSSSNVGGGRSTEVGDHDGDGGDTSPHPVLYGFLQRVDHDLFSEHVLPFLLLSPIG